MEQSADCGGGCAEIARCLVTLGLVVNIAASTVWRRLANGQPVVLSHLAAYSQPFSLSGKCQAGLAALRTSTRVAAQKGIWVVCVDEKTSIQARKREREWTPTPPAAGHPGHLSPRYKRKGALHLFAALSVADGQVYGQCRLRKRFVDFQAFLLAVVIPQALQRGVHTLVLILDNATTHAPKQLEHWLKEQIKLHGWELAVQVYWLPPNASWLNQIEIWFSTLQRKVLQPNHFERLGALRQDTLAFIAYYNQTAKPIQWSYTVKKLGQKPGTI